MGGGVSMPAVPVSASTEAALKKLYEEKKAAGEEDDAINAAGEEAPTSRGFGMSVTRDFIGAVGFYRRGGVGQVRFGRIVVEKGGTGYVLDEETMERLERESPALAMRLHKVMAGTLANQVVSRNKLITQYVR